MAQKEDGSPPKYERQVSVHIDQVTIVTTLIFRTPSQNLQMSSFKLAMSPDRKEGK